MTDKQTKASVFQRGDTWWIRLYADGRDIRFSTGLKEEDRAKRYLRSWLPLYQECQRLGIKLVPKEGLFQMAKRIESAWIRIERLIAQMRERGFLLG